MSIAPEALIFPSFRIQVFAKAADRTHEDKT